MCNGDFPGFSSKFEVSCRVLSCAKVCLCTKKPDEGDCCLWCGNHAGVTTRQANDAVCYFEDCVRQEQETLLPCTACNSEYHKECHKTARYLRVFYNDLMPKWEHPTMMSTRCTIIMTVLIRQETIYTQRWLGTTL